MDILLSNPDVTVTDTLLTSLLSQLRQLVSTYTLHSTPLLVDTLNSAVDTLNGGPTVAVVQQSYIASYT